MKKNYPKTITPILVGIALLVLWAGNASAQDNTVTGNTYAMYFLSFPNRNFTDLGDAGLTHIHMTFNEDASVAAMNMDGHGVYFAMPGFFAASYYIVNFRMGFESMDVFTGMTGITINPFTFGVGFFLIDYAQIIPYVFDGFILETMSSSLK
jgi:hypothetical protein